MKRFISMLAALSLISGTAPQSFALTPHHKLASHKKTPVSTNCSAPKPFIWKHFGGAPFARSEAESRKKLPKALDDMVALGCLPKDAVEGIKKLIHDQPQGTEVDGTRKLVPINNGMHFDFMESAQHPFLNVIVGLVKAGRGLVESVQAHVWVFDYEGVRYYFYEPLICFNWMLQRQGTPVAPPQPSACELIRTPIKTSEDESNHYGFYGPDAMKGPGDCWHWRYEGETTTHSYQECPDDACDYDAIADNVNHMHLVFKGRTVFAPPPGATYVEYSVSREFAERTFEGKSVNMALFCRELQDGRMSCGEMVRHNDYPGGIAVIYRSKADYLAVHRDSPLSRPLIWDFFGTAEECLRHWTH